jgi:hypothetical protein
MNGMRRGFGRLASRFAVALLLSAITVMSLCAEASAGMVWAG